jgi:hypothetical protein
LQALVPKGVELFGVDTVERPKNQTKKYTFPIIQVEKVEHVAGACQA